MKNSIKQRFLIFSIIFTMCFGLIPATVFATQTTGNSARDVVEVVADVGQEDVVPGITDPVSYPLEDEVLHSHGDDGELSVQGVCTDKCGGKFDSLLPASAKMQAAASPNAPTFTSNGDGTYTVTWEYKLPKATGFYYGANQKANIILTTGIYGDTSDTSAWKNAGVSVFSGSGYIQPGSKQYYLACAAVASKNRPDSDDVCYPRDWMGEDIITYQGTKYVQTIHTTLRTSTAKRRNAFLLASNVNVNKDGSQTSDAVTGTISVKITAAKYEDMITWCKTNCKKKDGNYNVTIAITKAANIASGYTHTGCQQHGVVWKELTGNAGNGISTCGAVEAVSGTIGTKVKMGVNQKEWYKQDSNECQISTWQSLAVPASTTISIGCEDVAKPYGYTGYYHVLKEYTDVTVDDGTVVKPSTHFGAAPSYAGYVYKQESQVKASADTDGDIVYRYYDPAPCTVTCMDIYYRGNEVFTQVKKGEIAAVHGETVSATAWANDKKPVYKGYVYRTGSETKVVCDATNPSKNIVYRYFDLGKYTVTYHANGGTGTIKQDSAYVGESIQIANASGVLSRVATNGSGLSWKVKGWSGSSGDGNPVEYTFGGRVTPNLGVGGNLDLYAVWDPALKIEWDDGINSVAIPGLREKGTQAAASSGTTTYHNYNTPVSIQKTQVGIRPTHHLKGAEINGKDAPRFIQELMGQLQNGASVLSVLNNCYNLEIHTEANPCNPEKQVVKSGTTTDVNGCLVTVGDKLDYIIKFQNKTSAVRDYRVVDTLDPGLTFVSASAETSGKTVTPSADGTLEWMITGVKPEEEITLKVTAVVNKNKVGDKIENVVDTYEQPITLLGETSELHERSDRVTNYVLDTPQKHLRSSETSTELLDDTILIDGDEAVYTITIKNPHKTAAKAFNVSDVIPSDLLPISASDNGSISGQTVTWQGVSVAAGSEKTIYVKVKAKEKMSGKDIRNKAALTCTDSFGTKIDSTEVLNYGMVAPVKTVYETLDKNLSPTTENAIVDINDQVINDGKLYTYRIEWVNPTAGLRSLIIRDTLPENTRIATSADLDKAMEGISLAQEYGNVNSGAYLISDGGIYDDATREVTWTIDSTNTSSGEEKGFVEFTIVVLDTAQDTYIKNTARQTLVSPTGINEHNPTMPSNEVINPVLPTPDKIATRADGQDVTELVVNDGEEITYEITFKNPAVDDREFTVTDIVPEFTTLVSSSISDGGVYDAAENMITWKMTLAGGETKTVSFAVTVDREAQNQTVKNTARVYVDRADKKTKEDEPTNIYILEDPTKAVLNLDGQDINGVVKRAGDIITYDIVYKNPADDERVATVTDKLPAGVEFISASHQGSYDTETGEFVATEDKNFKASYDPITHTVVWTAPTAGKCQEMVSVDVRILDKAKGTILRNKASVYIPDATKETNEVTTPVVENPVKISTDKDGQDLDGNLVTIGEEITYTIIFKNPAETAKVGFITDTLPVGVDFVSADESGAYDSTTHTVFWKNMPMQAGEEKQVNVVVRVNEDAASETIQNEAVYRIDEASVSTRLEDGGPGGPSSYVTTKYVLNDKGEDINKAVVMKENLLVYKITYKNITATEKHYTILDILPEGVDIVSVGDSGFFAVNPLPGLEDYKLPKNRSVAWQFYLQPQEEGFVTVTVRVNKEKEGEILYNNAVFSIQEVTDKEKPPFIKETNKVENPVLKTPVKMVFNDAGAEITDKMVCVGDEITYKITFVNPSEETKLADVRDMLPSEVEFISCDYNGTYDESLHMVKWSELEVESNERITVSCTVRVKEGSDGKTIKNQGTVIIDNAAITTRAKTPTSDPKDPEPSDVPTVDNYVACKKTYNLEGKDITSQVVAVGDVVTYRIMFANTSDTTKNYTVKDTLPEEVDFVSATGKYTQEEKTLVWQTTLEGGNTGYFDVVVKFNEKAYGKIVKNQARIVEYDPESPEDPHETLPPPADNPVFGKDDFVKKALDKKGKDIDNAFIGTGSDLNYVIIVRNPSEKDVEFTVTDVLPAEVTFAGCSDGGTYSEEEHMVTWNITLEGKARAELEIATKVKASVDNATIKNKAHLITSSTKMESNEVTNYVLASPVKKMFAGLTELKDGETVEGNTSVTFTISYSNPTDMTRTITIEDKLDADIADRVLAISDEGQLRNGVITWVLEVKPGVSGEVSFMVASPETKDTEVVNKAVVSLENEGTTGITTLDTNKVYYYCTPEDKPTDHPEKGGDDPGREIVKTGDELFKVQE